MEEEIFVYLEQVKQGKTQKRGKIDSKTKEEEGGKKKKESFLPNTFVQRMFALLLQIFSCLHICFCCCLFFHCVSQLEVVQIAVHIRFWQRLRQTAESCQKQKRQVLYTDAILD